jgi:formate hydrogenlyase subunit 3/multisubunit Na+/H+ antiporter MnhD subunit
MSAPILWILFPGLVAVILYNLRRWERSILLAGLLVATGLAWLAWWLPIEEPVRLGLWAGFPAFALGDTLTILGRRFILNNASRPVLVLIYLGVTYWFGGARVARSDRLFVPLGLAIAALFTAALAVEPFLYAALLIEMAALVSVPILSPPGRPVGRGVLRFLAFQTLGMPFLLFTGWLLTGAETTPAGIDLVVRAAILMGMGFAFLMAIFPFHTWIPMLAEEAHPYAAAFVLFFLPSVIALFGLSFLQRYPWLQTAPDLVVALRFVGMLMVLIGGVWAAFQRHLGRIMGYAAIMEIGLALLAISLSLGSGEAANPGGSLSLGIFFAQLLPRGIGLALWSLSLSILQQRSGGLSYHAVHGIARQLPVVAAGLLLAQFSIAGFPLLAGFPVSVALWSALAQQSLPITLLSVLGSAGLMIAGLRTLAVLVTGPDEADWCVTESWPQIGFLSLSGLALILVGILPQWFLPFLMDVARIFGR